MRTRLTILAAIAGTAALVLAASRSAEVEAEAAPPAVVAAADTIPAAMPEIEVLLPRDEREELYQAVLALTERVEDIEARVTRLEAELYVRQSELPGP